MARQPRLDAPGVLHHVMAHGIERQPIFTDDRDRDEFVRRLSDLASEGKLIVYAWSLMPNHFHLLVRAGKISLSRSMRSLLTGYAGYFNRRYRRHGHVFQNRFKSIICEEEPYFLELVRYLHLNPLRAGVVKDLNELDRYPYTGHSVLVGRIDRSWQDTEDVRSRFGETCRKAAKSYRAFVSDGVGQGRRPDLMGGGLYRKAEGLTLWVVDFIEAWVVGVQLRIYVETARHIGLTNACWDLLHLLRPCLRKWMLNLKEDVGR
ncbi:MAG: transposase [Deltaproteobacteria bacterium]|nr:transposase [Deltaproteobacteria bacterium]